MACNHNQEAVSMAATASRASAEAAAGRRADRPRDGGVVSFNRAPLLEPLSKAARGRMVLKKHKSVNPEKTDHMMMEGDNLEILKILRNKHAGDVSVIYIDPPYNTMKDRMYNDKNTHANWFRMMYPRLYLAKTLLSESGSIFVSIGIDEAHHLRLMLDDVFGEKNMISEVVWYSKYTVSNDKKFISTQHEYVMIYAKNKAKARFNLLPRTEKADSAYSNPDNDPRGRWKATPLHAKSGRKNIKYTFTRVKRYDGQAVPPFTWSAPKGRYPRYSATSLRRLEGDGRITCGRDGTGVPNVKTFLAEVKDGMTAGSLWRYDEVGHTHQANEELAGLVGKGIFDNPKPLGLIRRVLQLATTPHGGDIVLDFFAGSGTTAHAVLDQNIRDGGNRTFICIQDPVPVDRDGYRTIADITRRRVSEAIKGMGGTDAAKAARCGFKSYVLEP